jgi:hypothetical protein
MKDFYLTSKHHHPMPAHRWALLLEQIRAWRHPDREVDLTFYDYAARP